MAVLTNNKETIEFLENRKKIDWISDLGSLAFLIASIYPWYFGLLHIPTMSTLGDTVLLIFGMVIAILVIPWSLIVHKSKKYPMSLIKFDSKFRICLLIYSLGKGNLWAIVGGLILFGIRISLEYGSFLALDKLSLDWKVNIIYLFLVAYGVICLFNKQLNWYKTEVLYEHVNSLKKDN
ncbi:putative membrane protein [Methanococcus voltae]|uniref:hypothetical protein n=1 Tax=Methanococcus voltae TaxID=2188 RepID=UPI001AE9E158|nr:hypothetical protein [Methanococcus voltae]MBP2143900.1 putative membrane protein [Methanococcus voltae]